MIRFLRPRHIVQSSDLTWLVDESWPVAAAIDIDGSMTVAGWPWPRDRVDPELDHRVVADGVGIVVRDGEQVVWVRRQGRTVAHIDNELMLATADPDMAWFIDRSYIDSGDPPAPPPPLPSGRIVAVGRDGSRVEVPVSAPVRALSTRDDDLWVTVAEPPIAHSRGDGSWGFEYPVSVLSVGRTVLLSQGLASAVPATPTNPELTNERPYAWTWLESDPETVLRCGVRAGRLIWWAGASTADDYIHRPAVAVGHDPTTGQPVVRVDLGLGLVSDVQTVGGEVWLSVQRRRPFPSSPDGGVDVLAISQDRAVRTVYSANSVDISHFAPPMNSPPPEQIEHHINQVRQMFADLTHYWDQSGARLAPLSDGLTNPSVTIEGDWPDTVVVIAFEHRRRPGLLLRRKLPIFNEEGLPINHEYADIHLMEDLDTDHIAPAKDATDGILDT